MYGIPDPIYQWLILTAAPTLGPARINTLHKKLGSIDAILGQSDQQLAVLGVSKAALSGLRQPEQSKLKQVSDWLNSESNHLVTFDCDEYPSLLKEVNAPPALLFLKGDKNCLWQPQLAIVGSRTPTQGGKDNTLNFGRYLASHGLTLCSGLALGVDGLAHRAALQESATTIAVLGAGIESIYPRQHQGLASEIAQQGALVSEYDLYAPPQRSNFPARNRIISGLSLGTLVIEAGVQSGSLITARLAVEQGRDVFAIPGSIHNPLARGCHRLIKQGAKLVETADDIVRELQPIAEQLAIQIRHKLSEGTNIEESPSRPNIGLDEEYLDLLDKMGFDPTTVDALVENTGLSPQVISSMLLMLELKGMVQAPQSGIYCRV